MTMEFLKPVRGASPVLLGIAGPSGGGKTYSALRIARGLADGNPFALIDTENGRALHYADDFPDMRHANLRAPFSPEAYADAIRSADEQGFPVIVVDSASHEWEGDGGVLQMQEAEFERMGSKEAARLASWKAPKGAHKAWVRELLQTPAHVIFCMRAEDKVEMVKVNGRTEVRAKETLTSILGWIPICERRLPFELTMSVLVTPDAPGVPKPVKIQEQHKPFVPLDQPLSEETGKRLGEWARGSAGGPAKEPLVPQASTADNAPASVSQAVFDGDESASPAETPFITFEQEEQLIARFREAGYTLGQVKALVKQHTGQEQISAITRDRFDVILKAIEAAAEVVA